MHELIVYQLNISSDQCFMDYDFIEKHFDGELDVDALKKIYIGDLNNIDISDETCEKFKDSINYLMELIFMKLNNGEQGKYKMRSLSVSDIIEYRCDDERYVFFVDSFGFKDITSKNVRLP